MEYLERGSLRPYIAQLALVQVSGVLEEVLAALSHAEGRRIVHRDIKPENLLLTGEGGVKIADFGIAKACSGRVEDDAHARGRDGRHTGLHGARAGDGTGGRPLGRPLSDGRGGVRDARRRGECPTAPRARRSRC